MVRPLGETDAAWVPDYFGDDYLQLYQFPPERTAPEVTFLVRELSTRIPTTGQVLDLACGQCRHGLPLARHGFHVIGLDYQANLLREAAQQAHREETAISLVQGDMRQLPFAAASFDVVMNLFTAFGYFSDAENAHVLEEVARVLRPGGWLFIDVANRDRLLRQAQSRSWKRLPDESLVVSEWQWDVPTGRYTHWQLWLRGQQQREFQHSVRVYSCTELTAMLRQVGLTPRALYGGFQGEPLTLDAPRLVCLAQK
jgi:SAM-dependent methyltransferase